MRSLQQHLRASVWKGGAWTEESSKVIYIFGSFVNSEELRNCKLKMDNHLLRNYEHISHTKHFNFLSFSKKKKQTCSPLTVQAELRSNGMWQIESLTFIVQLQINLPLGCCPV
jgi:hypothetical protein